MKSMLYVGATLMIGASIYGFVDYKQTSQKKEFTEMYEHQVIAAPVVSEEKAVPADEKKVVINPVKKTKTPAVKPVVMKKTADDEVIAAIVPITDETAITEKETKFIEESKVDVKTSEESTAKKTKKKKLNHKLFSRGPLREELDEPVKKVKKTDSKVQ